jgi:hypothetical protein
MLVFSKEGSARNGKKKVPSKIPNIPQNIAGPERVFIGRGSTMEERLEKTAIFTSNRHWPCSEPTEIWSITSQATYLICLILYSITFPFTTWLT